MGRACLRLVGMVMACLTLSLAGCSDSPGRLDRALWDDYARRFISADGRVTDADSGPPGITHTEAQGYGLLLAEAAGDRQTFDRIWQWTQKTLRRPDGLFSWKFGPCGQPAGCVLDANNASDGDILIAWALLRAGRAWDRPDYVDAARAISMAVAEHQTVQAGALTLLLPGRDGFVSGQAVVVNPSYWLFPAFRDFAMAFGHPAWDALSRSALTLLRQGRFGVWGLPPDWMQVENGAVALAPDQPPQYGFNAVRVPLNLVWGGQTDPALLAPFRAFWRAPRSGPVPAWVDLRSGETAPYGWQTGMAAVAALTDGQADLPRPGGGDGYYAWSLALLARVAQADLRGAGPGR
ncbi:glycosyl hydrolase family 8 [Novispirillum itersonii]|uniref:Glucanase n=1 Tax=Novispirillum itersonii TaxID=189 RepID=A0A7X0DPI6_NOVIT|nr:glycosyl hydrolase family 8 [Novispirillum itersonii]MBB6211307.1 endoglucanase [Novispirillum itersonii]